VFVCECAWFFRIFVHTLGTNWGVVKIEKRVRENFMRSLAIAAKIIFVWFQTAN